MQCGQGGVAEVHVSVRRGRARKLCEGTDYEFAKSWAERREQEIRSSDALDHMRALAVRKTSACLGIRFVLLLLEEVVRHVPSEKNEKLSVALAEAST